MGNLTDWELKEFKEPGRYADGGGLFLLVAPTGSKSWVLRRQDKGTRLEKGLGGWPKVSLESAREKAAEAKAPTPTLIPRAAPTPEPEAEPTQDARPRTTPQGRPTTTFETYARNVHAGYVDAGGWSPMNAYNWLLRAQCHLFPVIGDKRLDELDVAYLRDDVLRPIATLKPETGKRLRIILNQVFEQAVEDGLLESNPIDRIPSKRLRRPAPVHRPALRYPEVPLAMGRLFRYRPANENHPWQATLLSFPLWWRRRRGRPRPGDATWTEVDLNARTWTIPAAKMKSRRDHVVPLSGAALGILREAQELSDGRGLIFPNPRRRRQAPVLQGVGR